MNNQDCIFCRIASKDIQANLVEETEHSLAFWDISPRQPIHILVIPKRHHTNILELTNNAPDELVDLMRLGTRIASDKSSGSFRLSFNTGAEAGQTVFHAHGHLTSKTPKDQLA
ncbi:Diadenosine tetraphosphate (Ap4A) hydrolase and other HIT family hydrolase [Rhodoluna lacicola]|uniref:Diadenosine tetraphosphate (Ap4A) hydrolase and other HIT family hydrolase n=1 Tax=Rhodoluna lacicola TaxID=529884 RepID=A0A060JFA0_9MICO|nr:Diadenosine tetraphosphate (Ap4A) hydrolase and other HIT family hydrolase [Rhodoluna lacicola]